MVRPAARNYAWYATYGDFKSVPVNYNWMSQNCGTAPVAQEAQVYPVNPSSYSSDEPFHEHWDEYWGHGGCGVCGDARFGSRDHELGGTYGAGVITGTYEEGGVVDITLDITANHRGSMQFRVCNVDDPSTDCNEYSGFSEPLRRADYPEETRWRIRPQDQGNDLQYTMQYRLPEGLTCTHCVLQWWWLTENNGYTKTIAAVNTEYPSPQSGDPFIYDSPTGVRISSGWPEEFYNCADIAIQANNNNNGDDGGNTSPPVTTSSSSTTTTTTTSTTTEAPTSPPSSDPSTTAAPPTSGGGCDDASSYCGPGTTFDSAANQCVVASAASPSPTTTTTTTTTTTAPPPPPSSPPTSSTPTGGDTCLPAWTDGCSLTNDNCCEGWKCEAQSWGSQCSERDTSSTCKMSGGECTTDSDCCDGQGLVCEGDQYWKGCTFQV